MDIPRKDASKKRLIRRIAIAVVVVAALVGTGLAVSRLKPAAPSIDGSVATLASTSRCLAKARASITAPPKFDRSATSPYLIVRVVSASCCRKPPSQS